MGEVVLAVDIGGTKTAAALADRHDTLLRTEVATTPAAEGPMAVVATVVALAERLLSGTGLRLSGVGIGAAGVVDAGSGTIVSATDTFADWPGTPLAALVRAGLGAHLITDAPVRVQNDVDAHAAGEYRHGGGGRGGECAHRRGRHRCRRRTDPGRRCRARSASRRGGDRAPPGAGSRTPALPLRQTRTPRGDRLRHRHAPALPLARRRPRDHRCPGIAAESVAGDPIARRAIGESAAAVGRAIAGAATILDPERIVVTGGVPNIGEDWWRPMRDAFHAEAIDALQSTPILPGTLGDDAPLRGAAASVCRNP
ncbi:ROK family protein [Microbacterium oxydans]|nr:ROK family protein [Microbacterium oxydans]